MYRKKWKSSEQPLEHYACVYMLSESAPINYELYWKVYKREFSDFKEWEREK